MGKLIVEYRDGLNSYVFERQVSYRERNFTTWDPERDDLKRELERVSKAILDSVFPEEDSE